MEIGTKITDESKVKVGDFVYSSYWHIIDQIVGKGDKWENKWSVKQITPINPTDDLNLDDIGKVRNHGTSLKNDRILKGSEVLEFIEEYCSPQVMEIIKAKKLAIFGGN